MSPSTDSFIPEFKYYDFHIYYQTHRSTSRDKAVELRDEIISKFSNEISTKEIIVKILRDELIGPHITNFFEVDIQNPKLFTFFFTWITLNRRGLDILVHPHSGNGYKDHIEYPVWIGNKLPLVTEGILKDEIAEISPYGLSTRQPNELKKLQEELNKTTVH